MKIRTKSCCKINIGLNIVSKREDGYHNLETIFYPVPLYDEITITSDSKDGIELEGHKLEGDPNENLVLKTVRLLRENGYEIPPVHISLKKNIPSGAGLGGGSSDAATIMTELNKNLSLQLSVEKMEKMIAYSGDIKRRFLFLEESQWTQEYRDAMEELMMVVTIGKTEHDDSADALTQLDMFLEGVGMAKPSMVINSPI